MGGLAAGVLAAAAFAAPVQAGFLPTQSTTTTTSMRGAVTRVIVQVDNGTITVRPGASARVTTA